MAYYIDDYFVENNQLGYSYNDIKNIVLDLNNQGKSIPEIKNYLMEKLDIYNDSEEQLIYERIINCMINNKRYCNRITKEIYQ